MKQKLIHQALVLAFATLGVSAVHAAGFQLLEQNASGLGNAYAGSAAVSENASTNFFNPAGLTQLKGLNASNGGTLVNASFKFKEGGSTGGAFAGTGDGVNAGTTALIPNMYGSMQLSPSLFAGIGISAPFGLKTEYEVPWVGSAQSNSFDIKTVNVNPNLAWKINDKVSLGGGLNYQQMEIKYQRRMAATNLASTTTLPSGTVVPITIPAAVGSNTDLTLEAQGYTWGWNAGVLFTPSDTTKLGFSYRSKLKYHLKGRTIAEGPSAAVNASASVAASANITTPATYLFSVSQKLSDKWEMLGDVSRTAWSSIRHVPIVNDVNNSTIQTLDADFRDSWRVALGATYQLSEPLKWKFGTAYDQSPVKNADTRLVSLPDNDRIWLSTGLQWGVMKNVTADVGLTYIAIKKAQINADQTSAARGKVVGSYTGHIWIAGAQLSMAF